MAEKFTQPYDTNDLKAMAKYREILRDYRKECAEIDKSDMTEFNKSLEEVCACHSALEKIFQLAQAPAMYEALKECLTFLDKQREEYNAAFSLLPRKPVGRGPIAEKAFKVLAKIEGK